MPKAETMKSDLPGFYQFLKSDAGTWMHYYCPCGCGDLDSICVGSPHFAHWTWDGNEQRPTLSPSLRKMGGCRWHGFLKNGNWECCSDGPPLASNIYRVPANV